MDKSSSLAFSNSVTLSRSFEDYVNKLEARTQPSPFGPSNQQQQAATIRGFSLPTPHSLFPDRTKQQIVMETPPLPPPLLLPPVIPEPSVPSAPNSTAFLMERSLSNPNTTITAPSQHHNTPFSTSIPCNFGTQIPVSRLLQPSITSQLGASSSFSTAATTSAEDLPTSGRSSPAPGSSSDGDHPTSAALRAIHPFRGNLFKPTTSPVSHPPTTPAPRAEATFNWNGTPAVAAGSFAVVAA